MARGIVIDDVSKQPISMVKLDFTEDNGSTLLFKSTSLGSTTTNEKGEFTFKAGLYYSDGSIDIIVERENYFPYKKAYLKGMITAGIELIPSANLNLIISNRSPVNSKDSLEVLVHYFHREKFLNQTSSITIPLKVNAKKWNIIEWEVRKNSVKTKFKDSVFLEQGENKSF